MVASISSIAQNAQVLRSAAESQQEQQPRIQPVESAPQAPQAPFISPVVSVDTEFGTPVILLRDSDSGEVVTQIPSEPALQAQRRIEAQSEAARERAAELEANTQDIQARNAENNSGGQSSVDFVRSLQATRQVVQETSSIQATSPTQSTSTTQQVQQASAGANSLASLASFNTAFGQAPQQVGTNINVSA